MTADRTNPAKRELVRAVVAEALALPVGERDSFVRARCGDDEAARAEVLVLISRAGRAEDRAPATRTGHRRRPQADSPVADEPQGPPAQHERPIPDRIGSCTIKQCIGEGGMGVVYEGEQQNPRRRVAVKLMRADNWSAGLVSRFRQEAELLGRLEHPGIARVYEAGHARPWGERGPDLPYLVMELVDGSPLTAHATRHGLDARQRLRLIGLVCEAVHHAHERGVVHRDLKPANVLVDASGQPRVLDFGVARAVDEGTDGLVTQTATSQFVGTLPYMSPEQVSGKPNAVGPRSDVYALGVLAYELLAGHRPIPVAGLSLAEAIHQVQHVDPPRLGAIDTRLGGDIEAIVGKALEKEPERRYSSAAAMAADIQRFLDEQPIQARPPSAVYRATKFVRRNTAVVGAMVGLVLVLLAGVATTTWLALRETRARQDADRNAVEARWLAYGSALTSALLALDEGDARAARKHVDAAPPELREWTWRHVASRLDDATDRIDLGAPSDERATRIVARDDGKVVVLLSDGLVVLDAPADRLRLVRRIVGDFAAVSRDGQRGLEFAGGRWLDRSVDEDDDPRAPGAASGPSATLDLGPAGGAVAIPRTSGGWVLSAPPSGEEPRTAVYDHEGHLLAILPLSLDGSSAVSADDRVLATRQGSHLVLAELAHGGRVSELGRPASALAFTPDGRLLVAIDAQGRCDTWRTDTGAPGPWRAVTVASVPVHLLVMTPSGDHFITVDQRGRTALWRTADGALERELAEVGYFGHALALAPGGSDLAVAQASGGLRLIELDTWDAGLTVVGPTATLTSLAFLPGSRRLVGIDRQGWLRLFVDPERSGTARLRGHGSFVYDVAVDAEGHVASIAWDSTARIWGARTGELLRTLTLRDPVGRVVALLPGGTVITAASTFTEAWDLETGRPIAQLPGNLAVRTLAAWASTGRVAYGAEDGSLGWWNPTTGEQATLASVGQGESEVRIALTASASRLAWSQGHAVGVLSLPSGAPVWTAEIPGGSVLSIDLDAQGDEVAVACRDGALFLVTRAGQRRINAPGDSPLYAVRFHLDGRLLATGAQDGTVTTWDRARGAPIAQLRGHRDYVHGLAFSPDGKLLASASADATVGTWSTLSRAQLATKP